MKPPFVTFIPSARPASWLTLALVATLLISCSPERDAPTGETPSPTQPAPPPNPAEVPETNAAAADATAAPAATNQTAAAVATNAPADVPAASTNQTPARTDVSPTPVEVGRDSGSATNTADVKAGDDGEAVQLSFQGANVDLVVQWLARTTGKSVVKHPRVQCQLTIVSSRKLPPRDAINLVYRALSLEGFTTIESSRAILIVPEGQEPKMSPELINGESAEWPDGPQRLVKVFPLRHVPASEMKERIKGVLSDKASVEADDRGGKLIVTDSTENIRLLSELLPELDAISTSDSVIRIFDLKHLDAEDMANLLNLVLNGQPGMPPSRLKSTSPSGSRSRSSYSPGIIRIYSSSPSSSPVPSGASSTPATPPAPFGDMEVRFWPDRTSNRLIVSAPQARIEEIANLIQLLDVEKPADVAIRVLPLQHVSAVDLMEDLGPLYEKMSGQSLKDIIEVGANERSNSLIVLSNEENFKAIQELVRDLDTESAQEKTLQSFALKHADAEDVAEQLQKLNQDQNPFTRYIYYYSPQPARSAQVSVVADRRRNTVIVQGPPAAMPAIAEIIAALDEPVTDNSLAPRIFPLKYVSAVDIVDVLNELFLKKQQTRAYWNPFYEFGQTGGGQDDEAGRLYGKVRITSEPYSNSIIVTSNSPESMAAVEDVIKQLDVPSQAGENTIRIGLKFAEAVPTANNLNILFARGGSPPLRPVPQQGQQIDPRAPQQPTGLAQGGFQLEQERAEESYYPWLGGPPENLRGADGQTTLRSASDLVGRVRVVPDTRSNSLLVTANVHFLAQVLKLINELDVPTSQVLIECKIIVVSTDFRERYGVRWSPDGTRVFEDEDFENSLMPSAAVNYLKVFAGSIAPGANEAGVLDASMNLDLLIQFLRKDIGATVLAEPQINVSDNELGKLFVGSQVPFISSSLNTQEGGRNDSFQYKDVGIILEVTPHINNAEDVALKIHAESSNIRSGETLFGGAILDTRNFHTDLSVKTGQTVVLGGIIQQEDGETVRKVPFLGDIPGLGWLFKKKDKATRNVELMVFLRPRITRSPEEVEELLRDVDRKMPSLKELRDSLDAPAPEEGPAEPNQTPPGADETPIEPGV